MTCRAVDGGGRWGRGRLRQRQPSRDTKREDRLGWDGCLSSLDFTTPRPKAKQSPGKYTWTLDSHFLTREPFPQFKSARATDSG